MSTFEKEERSKNSRIIDLEIEVGCLKADKTVLQDKLDELQPFNKKDLLQSFVEWLEFQKQEDAFYVFDNTDEAISEFLEEQ